MDRTGPSRVAVATLIVALITSATGGARQTAPSSGPTPTSATVTLAKRETGTVVGTAWRADNTPLPRARIRLRNVRTGRSVARVESDSGGRFRFNTVEPDPYVVELLSNHDEVLALGELFGVTADTTATTWVRLSSRAPWFAGFFGNAAAAVIAAASGIGVTAVGTDGRPASPQ